MARRLIYKIPDNGKNFISEQQWERILKLQNWYNSEFFWSAGKLALKRFLVFPDYHLAGNNFDEYRKRVENIRKALKNKGASEFEIIKHLETNGLVFIKNGGYFDNCIASGYTRVGQNEFNAYLVCDYLLKVSLIANKSIIEIYDEGNFIKCKKIFLKAGDLFIAYSNEDEKKYLEKFIEERKVFSIVNPKKYDNIPKLRHQFMNYNKYTNTQKLKVLHNWNWLGFEDSYDFEGDDLEGYDLNKKIRRFLIDDKIN